MIQSNKRYNNPELQYLNFVVRYWRFEYHIDRIMLNYPRSSRRKFSMVTRKRFRTRLLEEKQAFLLIDTNLRFSSSNFFSQSIFLKSIFCYELNIYSMINTEHFQPGTSLANAIGEDFSPMNVGEMRSHTDSERQSLNDLENSKSSKSIQRRRRRIFI